ncbi:MAG: hypothetical protein QOI01_3238, partial [Mycobacterium sp.]|nr:hypothetical protein [Mycobacterium sp.]
GSVYSWTFTIMVALLLVALLLVAVACNELIRTPKPSRDERVSPTAGTTADALA